MSKKPTPKPLPANAEKPRKAPPRKGGPRSNPSPGEVQAEGSVPAAPTPRPALLASSPIHSRPQRPSSLLDTRVVYCGDNLEQLAKLPDHSIDLIYIDPPFNSNRNYEVFWGETKEKRSFEDRHANTKAYIEYMRPRCQQL